MNILFKHLEKKITCIVSLTIPAFVLLASILVYLIIQNIVYNNFIQLSTHYTAERTQNVQLYMNLIEETSKQLSFNPRIISALESSEFDTSVIPILDSIRSFNLNIIGISVYGEKNSSYASSSVYTNSMTDNLGKSPIFQQFKNSQKQYFWIVRCDGISDIYSDYYYDKKVIFSLVSKIYDADKNVIGYLLVDTNINSLYGFFKSNTSSPGLQTNTYILTSNNNILTSPYNSTELQTILNEIKKADTMKTGFILTPYRKNVLVFNEIPDSYDKMVVSIPTDTLFAQLHLFMAALLLLLVVFVILSIPLSIILARSISKPLSNLYLKMKTSVQEIE